MTGKCQRLLSCAWLRIAQTSRNSYSQKKVIKTISRIRIWFEAIQIPNEDVIVSSKLVTHRQIRCFLSRVFFARLLLPSYRVPESHCVELHNRTTVSSTARQYPIVFMQSQHTLIVSYWPMIRKWKANSAHENCIYWSQWNRHTIKGLECKGRANKLLVILFSFAAISSLLQVLPLDATGTATTEGWTQGKVDVLLRVQANDEAWNIHQLLADTKITKTK